MAATIFGTISFGTSSEVGLFIESADFNYTSSQKFIADNDGDDVAGALFKPQMTFSLNGAYSTAGAPTWVMGGTVTIANMPAHAAFIAGYTTGGRIIVDSVTVGLGNESEQRRQISGIFKPFMA